MFPPPSLKPAGLPDLIHQTQRGVSPSDVSRLCAHETGNGARAHPLLPFFSYLSFFFYFPTERQMRMRRYDRPDFLFAVQSFCWWYILLLGRGSERARRLSAAPTGRPT